MPTTTTHHLNVPGIGPVDVTLSERGSGHPFLLLHGGAGPQSVAGFAELLAGSGEARVSTPTHPGFAATPRPDALKSVAGLAATYVALLEKLDLTSVTIIGNSIGGWICAEMGLLDTSRIGGLVLVNAVGIDVPDHPIADIFSLTLEQVVQRSYHDPAKFRAMAAAHPPPPPEILAANRAALALYGGQPSTGDATLRPRLGRLTRPTLVLWGESDRIVDQDYGRAFAAAIPGATFELLPNAGHVPQIETPQQLVRPILSFAQSRATR